MRDPQKDIGILWQRHAGKRILVCGLGPSLESTIDRERPITISVNDCGRYFDPDYLVLVDRPSAFSERIHHRDKPLDFILNSRPRNATVVVDAHFPRWEFLLRDRHKKLLSAIPETIPEMANLPMPKYKGNTFWHLHGGGGGSPLTAVSLAGFMGATSIGVIGVDWIDHPRIKEMQFRTWSYKWDRMRMFLNERNIDLWCLSPESKLCNYVERMSLDDWLAGRPEEPTQGPDGDRARQRPEQGTGVARLRR